VAVWLIKAATGAVDGVNVLFNAATDYKPGSVVVFLNGISLRSTLDDGWVELGGNTVQLLEAPLALDVVQIGFAPIVGFSC
jgi:hypothetical protein